MKHLFSFLIIAVTLTGLNAQITLPKLISNGMVLQRNHEVKIWGWASNGEQVKIQFLNKTYETEANDQGEWSFMVQAHEAGGPHRMVLTGSNEIIVDSIYFGDVWLCSGQSNMEINMKRVSPLYPNDIKEASNAEIRYFHVPREYDFNHQRKDLSYGEWKPVTPSNVLSFSAVSYFFAVELYEKYKVPIGLINSALGGSPIECWINEEHLKDFPGAYDELQKFKDSSFVEQIKSNDRIRENEWHTRINQLDKGYLDSHNLWKDGNSLENDWETMELPGNFKEGKNGVIWVKRSFEVPENMAGKEAKLNFGCVVDADSIYINGIFVGNTTYRYPPRRYTVPAGVLKAGANNIAVRVISRIQTPGFVEDKPYEIVCNNEQIDLKGNWFYKYGVEMEPLQPQTFIRWKPAGLYNAMIAPLTNYTIKGALWYQGESNTHNANIYDDLIATMIKNWRSSWNQGDFPIIVAQLPNYMEPKAEPSESNWALMRESQASVLKLNNTALAVMIDIGEWNDIHPLNKKEVGRRMALGAQKIAYNESIVSCGPIYESHEIQGGKIILSFSNIGSGLKELNGELKEFAIASTAKKFVWAKAKIEGDKVIVWSDEIKNPVAVRYAWADNPDKANLYNKEGLPASPFRTDDW